MSKTIVITSGYFNPLHKGHVEYIQKAYNLGMRLVVIVNSDEQVKLKGSEPFMDLEERMIILRAMKYIDYIYASIDEDLSVCKTIERTVNIFRELEGAETQFIFAKGGDRNSRNIPEKAICKKLGVKIVDGLGRKIQSSSDLLKKKDFVRLQIKIKEKK